ncbi:MAG TPA: 16S rRNA (guanine(527)-N(7))-methyltransferase RsmG [Ruminococcaceae bacterium]|nr:16S rRNA (guanine(527)-N(7))-methyltransferase RsmG [Oscillospiraceae bacterium]
MLNRALLYKITENMDVKITDDAFNRFDTYAELLFETNKQFNLTAITEPDDMTVKHFADCLSVFKYADFKEGARLIDVGTGAGFPGLVILLARPDLDVTFLDGTGKKLAFIESVLSEVGLNGHILHRRAEEAGNDPLYREKFDFATARAVASLPVLCEYCIPFIKKGGSFISMKSAFSDDEISSSSGALRTLGGKIESDNVFDLVENTKRRIIIIKKISQTPPKYPRPSAKISKNPLG